MSQLIDLCGMPIQLDKVKDFRLVKRECLFYPAYEEMEEQVFSVFARFGAERKKKFKFVKMVPYGILLNDKEKPSASGYEIKSFSEAISDKILNNASKSLNSLANLAADILRIDTSGNKEYRILTQGHRLESIKLREIPAKVHFLSGKISDVHKNDPNYDFLGESIAPTIVPVPTLIVNVDKAIHVFIQGIDIDDAEAVYHSLFDAYKELHENTDANKSLSAHPRLSLPKLNLTSFKVQISVGIGKKDTRSQDSSTSHLALQDPEDKHQ